MSTLQYIPGDFGLKATEGSDNPGQIIDRVDTLGPGGLGRTSRISSGVTLISDVAASPGTREAWTIVGWTLQIKLAWEWFSNYTGPAPYGRFGDLWAGLLVDSPTSAQAQALLPINQSTFTKIWSGATDPIKQAFQGNHSLTLVAQTFMFPAPVVIRPAARLQMALILTSSLLGISARLPSGTPDGSIIIFAIDASYQVLYTESFK